MAKKALRDETGPNTGKGISPGGHPPRATKISSRCGGKALVQAQRQDASSHPHSTEEDGSSQPSRLFKLNFGEGPSGDRTVVAKKEVRAATEESGPVRRSTRPTKRPVNYH